MYGVRHNRIEWMFEKWKKRLINHFVEWFRLKTGRKPSEFSWNEHFNSVWQHQIAIIKIALRSNFVSEIINQWDLRSTMTKSVGIWIYCSPIHMCGDTKRWLPSFFFVALKRERFKDIVSAFVVVRIAWILRQLSLFQAYWLTVQIDLIDVKVRQFIAH